MPEPSAAHSPARTARDVSDAMAVAVGNDAFDGQALKLSVRAAFPRGGGGRAGAGGGGRGGLRGGAASTAREVVRAFGLDDWMMRLILDYACTYSQGFGDFSTDAVRALTGREPRDIGSFARKMFVPMAASMAGTKAA